jgi:tryptophan synthase alpha chain
MSRIDDIFASLRAEGATALMPFITAGYPSLDVTEKVLPKLEKAGARIVEIGFPFSDPIADGPVIASSMHEALAGGVTPRKIFDLVKHIRPTVGLGLIAMVSESIIARIGEERFVNQAANAGFDGLIVPDIDLDAADELKSLADSSGLSLSLLLAPTSTEARIRRIAAICSGFVYLLARVGITGETDAAPEIAQQVERVRAVTDLPIAVGFGISRAEHVAAVTNVADAAIVGSALVRRMGEASDPVEAASAFVAGLAAGLRRQPVG